MSDLAIVRRRLAALEECERILAHEWGETNGGGAISIYTDRMAVDARKHLDPEGSPDGVWITASGLYKLIQELREDVEGMAAVVEKYHLPLPPRANP